jgi:hypothetical protein
MNAAQHTAQALDLRIKGHSFREIGAAVGISEKAAWALIDREFHRLREECEEKRAIVIAIEVARLDRMLAKLDPAIDVGDPDAIRTAIQVGARRSRLLGLDAPTQVNVTAEPPNLGALDRSQLAALAKGEDPSKFA